MKKNMKNFSWIWISLSVVLILITTGFLYFQGHEENSKEDFCLKLNEKGTKTTCNTKVEPTELKISTGQ